MIKLKSGSKISEKKAKEPIKGYTTDLLATADDWSLKGKEVRMSSNGIHELDAIPLFEIETLRKKLIEEAYKGDE